MRRASETETRRIYLPGDITGHTVLIALYYDSCMLHGIKIISAHLSLKRYISKMFTHTQSNYKSAAYAPWRMDYTMCIH